MVDVHEVFSTSITLDEVEKANREAGGHQGGQGETVRLCHASTLLPLKHEHDHHAFIPFSPLLCAFYAGSDQTSGSGDTCIYLMRVECDGSHSLVQKLDCPQLNQKAHSTPVLFYLNHSSTVRSRLSDDEKALLQPPVQGKFVTSVPDMIAEAQSSQVKGAESGDNEHTVGLIYKAARAGDASVSYLSMSFDEGFNFVTPRVLVERPDAGRGPVRTKPYIFRKGPYAGRVLFPSSVESKEGLCFVDYSDDNIRTLMQSNEIAPDESQKVAAAKSFAAYGVVQATLFETLGVHRTGDDCDPERQKQYAQVHMLMSASGSQLFVADSSDGGATWGHPYPINLYNCNAGIDAVTYQNRLLCCGKLVTRPELCDYAKGAPLSLYMSKDGMNFTKLLTLEDEPLGTFTSPYLQIDRRHHLLYISYTDHRKAIKIRIFRLMLE